MSEPSPKDPAPAEDADSEPRPGRVRKPIGWSTIIIAVLVAVSAGLVWRRDGADGVLDILTHDLSLFSGILPRVLAGCLLGAFISEILPHEKVSRSLGPKSGLMGLLIGTAFGAILPGGPFTAYPVASALLAVGADFGATIAMVVSWTLIGYGRAVAWEIPIMGTDFTLWRIVISLPLPVLAGALGRFVYVRLYPKPLAKDDEN
ncbi:permease [Bradyrhizobium diversitatis]|uniref:Permease n=1 Tax=Bradyrhizobium diversitatis TaxID=2755406 RepID=A0ABS0P0G7_9BRAD|nr:permease [Bradyrhizobium diversitatis]MBH5386751.1 permease [Bradyrhizobium diversitatis]